MSFREQFPQMTQQYSMGQNITIIKSFSGIKREIIFNLSQEVQIANDLVMYMLDVVIPCQNTIEMYT
jgi:hypothetical protein